ncbi:glycosyltransferase family 4 protein [Nonomuraea soli]|uniref:Glycosyltransferase involved in cell wall biosynthesis n=1 Tax=Nonomuraea soli TaxID=1032476 RepID=A0A7W0CI07_9ACTN|nr:glycosyltransferase family 4 protein [Nonomuraea soli]MBA2891483.1 glycosyltransferase involved in cell wall biosynthesis [Nonomuraea soli]
MKIRYLILHAYGLGGTIRTVTNQANALAARGHDVEIVSVVRRRDKGRFWVDPRVRRSTLVDQRDGVEADSVPRRVWRKMRGQVVPRGEFAADYFTEKVEKAVIDYVAELDDGILVTTRPALNLISARRASRKVIRVAQEHMSLTAYREPVRRDIARYYGRFDAVQVLTRANQEEYRQLLPGTEVVRIPNAVHAMHSGPSQQENPVVVAVGRLVHQKGFDLLIPAFQQVAAKHPGWQLKIFGSGPKKADLGALIENPQAVKLMGATNKLDEELSKASIYVLSSRFEGLPMAMIEAMTHALPVVSFDCPTGPADVLTDGTDGFLVEPGDVDRLADALDRLISDRDLRTRMGSAAAATAKEYSADAVIPLWEELFAELSSRHSGSA